MKKKIQIISAGLKIQKIKACSLRHSHLQFIAHVCRIHSAYRIITQSVKLPIFQLHMSNGGVESSVERCDRAVADDLDTCSHTARDSAPRAEPIQI